MSALIRTEIRLALREPVTLVVTLAFPLLLLVVLLAVFGNQPDEAFGGVGGTDFYVPAYAAAVIAATGLIAVPVHLAAYAEQGVLRRFDASGVSRWLVLAAQVVVALVVVGVGSVSMVAVGLAAYDLSVPVDVAGVAVAFVVATVAFTALGVLLAALLPSVRAVQASGLFAFFGMFFIAGGGPPRALLPDWLGTVGDWLPLSYAVEAVRDPWVGAGWSWPALALLVVVLVLGAIASVRLARP